MRSGVTRSSRRRHLAPQPNDLATESGEVSGVATSLRGLPSVEALRLSVMASLSSEATPSAQITQVARATLAAARLAIRREAAVAPPSLAEMTARVLAQVRAEAQPLLRPVINATGVIINTNLGRAPLSAAAIQNVASVAAGYSTLEYDLEAGERGSRQTPIQALLRSLTGAEAALVVNNNAAATLVTLAAMTAGREVIVSRGELVEIGGGFRVPDVMRQSGARLVEVGTTNRTRASDYAAAITSETAALLSVHPSNFRVVGFTEAPELAALATLAHNHSLPLLHDLGSGALVGTEAYGLAHEPTARESLVAGADVVCFSGDKLLGAPQAGIIVGRADLLAQIARHPLMRAVRIDKLSLAALETTLREWRDEQATHAIPIWRMITTPPADLRARADRWATSIRAWAGDTATDGRPAYQVHVEVIAGESTVGGGSLPGETLPTWLCAISLGGTTTAGEETPEIGELARHLRTPAPPALPVVGRVSRDRLLLDPRTVFSEQDDALLATLRAALGAD